MLTLDYTCLDAVSCSNSTHFILSYSNSQTGTLTNSKDPDEMPHNEAFHQDLNCLQRRQIFMTVNHYNLEISTCENLYKMGYPIHAWENPLE